MERLIIWIHPQIQKQQQYLDNLIQNILNKNQRENQPISSLKSIKQAGQRDFQGDGPEFNGENPVHLLQANPRTKNF